MGRRELAGTAAFTLLELLVTLLVLVLAAAVVVPAVGRGTASIRARAEVARFSATFRRAREEAITLRERRTVQVDLAARRVAIISGPDGARTAWTLPGDLDVRAVPPEALEVRFDPAGVSSGGQFHLTALGLHFRVTVDPLTGRVRSVRE